MCKWDGMECIKLTMHVGSNSCVPEDDSVESKHVALLYNTFVLYTNFVVFDTIEPYTISLMLFVEHQAGRTKAMNVGPCHHGMARPQVADGGMASNMEGSCE